MNKPVSIDICITLITQYQGMTCYISSVKSCFNCPASSVFNDYESFCDEPRRSKKLKEWLALNAPSDIALEVLL